MLNARNKLILQALLVMALWGSLFPMVKVGYSVFNVATVGDTLFFAGMRFTVCGAIITAFCVLQKKEAFLGIKQVLVPILLMGFFAVVLHYGCMYLGLTMTAGAKTSILKQVGMLFYICFSAFVFPEDKLTLRKLIGTVLGILGIIVVNIDASGFHIGIGDWLIIASSFAMMISNVISKKTVAHVDPIVATGISQLFGGMILLCVGFASGGALTYTSAKTGVVFFYICAASIVSYCLWYSVVKKGALSDLFIIKFAETLFAAIFSAILLGEQIFHVSYLAAFLFICTGIWIAEKKPSKE